MALPTFDEIIDPIDNVWTGVVDRLKKHPFRADLLGGSAVALTVLVDVARRTLDAGIVKIHGLGKDGASANSLHDGRDKVRTAFEVWNAGAERLRVFLGFGPFVLAAAQTVLELLLTPLTFIVMFGLVRWLRNQFASLGAGSLLDAGVPDTDVSTEEAGSRSAIRRILLYAAVGVVVYTVLGLVDQFLELFLLSRWGWTMHLAVPLQVAAFVRTFVRLGVLLACAIGVYELATSGQAGAWKTWWRGTGTSYRIVVMIAIVHGSLLLVSIPAAQTEDALRLWIAHPLLAVFGVAATVMLSLVLSSVAIYLRRATAKRLVLDGRATWTMFTIGTAVGAVGLAQRNEWVSVGAKAWSAGAIALGVLVAVTALLSVPLPKTVTDETLDKPGDVGMHLPAVLAFGPLLALAVALMRSSVPSILDKASNGWLVLYSFLAAAHGVGAWCLVRWSIRWIDQRSAVEDFAATDETVKVWYRNVLLGVGAVTATLLTVVLHDPLRWAPSLGLAAIAAVALGAATVVFGWLGTEMERRALPASLDLLKFRRIPIFTTLVLLGLLSRMFASPGYHDLATLEGVALPETSQGTVADAFEAWAAANTPTSIDDTGGSRPVVPMVFIAAAGGGIKAAAFTATAIDCVMGATSKPQLVTQSAEPVAASESCSGTSAWKRLFAASGASGGSVGIASVLAERSNASTPDTWVSQRLGRDMLSAEFAWQLMVEVPNAVLHFNPSLDRGELLQESWRRSFHDGSSDPGGSPFFVDRSKGLDGPMVFLSGTNLNDGCRVNISPVGAGEFDAHGARTTRDGPCQNQRVVHRGSTPQLSEARDLTDYLCGRNISLATAAFLSARFPAVSPTGTVRCPSDDPANKTIDRSLSIGDGGYRDNSGAAALLDTWTITEPLIRDFNATHDVCIVPILVEINNGYDGLGAPSRGGDVPQILAPAKGASKVFGSLSYGPIEQLAAAFARSASSDGAAPAAGPLPLQRFYRLSLVDHPGVTAPLGWSLSPAAVEDLADQLTLANSGTLTELRKLLEPSGESAPQCAPRPRPTPTETGQ